MEIFGPSRETLPISMQRLWQELLECVREPVSSLKLRRQIVSLLQKPNPVILDICNDGTDTRRFLRLCPRAQLYCFEPDP
ncbi:2-O-methyltransferase NoeI (fragment) [Mesorhizobium delmotii]|uniref:2-O-methyltransferase NoeI n=1 Tax=Mesorhizobium delmotii TaxID=1631247 RepID=A0A2P9ALJ8_9HYPH